MKLVWNWRRWYRMFCIQGLALIAAIQSVLLVIPADKAQSIVPFTTALTWSNLGFGLTIAAAALSALGRLIDQGTVTKPPEGTP